MAYYDFETEHVKHDEVWRRGALYCPFCGKKRYIRGRRKRTFTPTPRICHTIIYKHNCKIREWPDDVEMRLEGVVNLK